MRKRRYEYGGYLPFELPNRKEYFDFLPESHIFRVNAGRTAFYSAVKALKVHKVYTPYLNCANSVDPIIAAGADIEYYFLNDDLTPKNVTLKDGEAILWINYYGNASEETIQKVYEKYSNLIMDNCNAFWSLPLENAYNCYSARKFFGVADGAYLIHPNISNVNLNFQEDTSANETEFLLKTIEMGTNSCYNENLKNEERLCDNYKIMSPLTKRILSSIDYSTIREIRQKNLLRLHKNIGHKNKFKVNIKSKTQMYYPFLVEQDSLRERLIKERIYTPTWWRHVPKQSGYATLETWLSKYMVFLPIDQRYDENDMDVIADIVLKLVD